MPITAKIERLDIFHIQTANQDMLDLEVSFQEDGEELGRKRMALPIDTTEEDVQAAAQRQLKAFRADLDRKATSAERARVDAQIAETRDNLVGRGVTAGEGDNET